MTTKRIDNLLSTLQQFFNPREEGWVWVALERDDLDRGVVSQIEGAYDDPSDAARGLTNVIEASEADRAYVAICRWDGRPTEDDRAVLSELDRTFSADRLIDMVAFNDVQRWSMRADSAAAA